MSFNAISATSTGLQAASTYLDVVSNNVANSNTTGFKSSLISFQDLLYTGPRASTGAAGQTQPQGTQTGTGVGLGSIVGRFTPGVFTQTGNQLDIAINGNGFLAVTLQDGSTGYTRAGDLTTDGNGQVVTSDGFLLQPPITVPPGTTSVNIGPDGTVTAVTSDGPQQLGQIQLTTFPNPAGLLRVGNTTFTATGATGTPVTGVPGTQGLGTIQQGALEGSNVDLTTELINLIVAQRAFSFNTQALTVENAILSATTDLIR